MAQKVYQNSTELMQLHGRPVYMKDMVDACLYGRLNLFLQGNTGDGKTQLAKDAMSYFGDNSLFVLGRNDMDTRELFRQLNPEFFRALKEGKLERGANIRELTNKINTHLIVVDEMPNCVPAVRAQLFNLFDGFVELDGVAYPIGNGYSVGIATGNIGQRFTESSNDLGRALKDRMHVVVDTDYFYPQSSDTLDILATSTNPRVEFTKEGEDETQRIIARSKKVSGTEVPLEKLIIANYLLHGLDYCSKGSKRKMKEAWPNQLENNEQGSDVALVLPCSTRAAKSVLRLSQSLDEIVRDKGATEEAIQAGYLDSMMQAYKFVAAYSGVLNESMVDAKYEGNKYGAMDAVITTTKQQFDAQKDNLAGGMNMVLSGRTDQRVMEKFSDRWQFMRSILENLAKQQGGN
jgi:MoxR-like ATPase